MDGTSGQQARENNGIAAGVWGRPRPAHVRQNLVGISKLPQASLRGGRLARNSEPLLPRHIIEGRRVSAGWYTGLVEVHPLYPIWSGAWHRNDPPPGNEEMAFLITSPAKELVELLGAYSPVSSGRAGNCGDLPVSREKAHRPCHTGYVTVPALLPHPGAPEFCLRSYS